ncbi:polysaccharide lyase [Streptomyces sp. NPDC054933]
MFRTVTRHLLVAATALLMVVAGSAVGQAAPRDTAAWTGTFDGFNGSAWAAAWGVDTSDGHDWGWDQMRAVSDPDRGSALQVFYGQGSGAHSCYESGDCPNPGGGQFYMDLSAMGRSDLVNASSLDLRYYVKFDNGFDFGRGGKLPGLYGGAPGSESGGNHDGSAFSTRYMWRDHPNAGAGEVYFYSPTGSGYGDDLGLGNWQWQGDGQWHAVEQQVDRSAGTVKVWLDGQRVLTGTGVSGLDQIPFGGVFFSTFFGGSDNSWGPGQDEHAYFADFELSTQYIGP